MRIIASDNPLCYDCPACPARRGQPCDHAERRAESRRRHEQSVKAGLVLRDGRVTQPKSR